MCVCVWLHGMLHVVVVSGELQGYDVVDMVIIIRHYQPHRPSGNKDLACIDVYELDRQYGHLIVFRKK